MTSDAITVRRERNAAVFSARVEPWLLLREPEHNVLLGLLPKLASGHHEFEAPIYLAAVERGGEVAGCVFRTPPYKLGVTRFPTGAEDRLAVDVGQVYDSLPAVLGREEDATRLADAWCRLKGGSWSIGMRQRIHRLDVLVPPENSAPGSLRLPQEDERPLVVRWLEAFARESGIGGSPSGVLADVLIGGRDLFLWDDGGPVAMVAAPGFTPKGARVGYVYTRPDRRGQGYGTAAVAELSRRQLDAGRRFCMLYTDIANPISNGIYERLGYRPVVEVVDVNLADATPPAPAPSRGIG